MIAELPYSLRSRKISIAIAWTVIVIPPVLLNLGLIYGLWFGTDMDKVVVITIPTAILGVFTAIAIIERVLKLIRESPQYRPIGSSRFALDTFQWGYFLALVMISTEISLSLSIPRAPVLELVSMAAPSLMFLLASLLLLTLIMNAFGFKPPFRLGSFAARQEVVRPAVYYVVEDVVAVDGGGGMEYREAFDTRYKSSPVFRNMIWTLSIVWMISLYLFAGAFTAIVFLVNPKIMVVGVAWGAPFLWGALMAVGTTLYVQRCLRIEQDKDAHDNSADESDDSSRPIVPKATSDAQRDRMGGSSRSGRPSDSQRALVE